jgi:hypothetical protein
MQTKEWTFTDKTTWGEGPWSNEPDKIDPQQTPCVASADDPPHTAYNPLVTIEFTRDGIVIVRL